MRKNDLTFKGGTAIDLFYGSNRFSEDLDFDCPDLGGLANIDDALERLEKDGVYKIHNDWESEREMHRRFVRYTVRVSSKKWERVAGLTIDYVVDKPKYPPAPLPMKYNDSIVSVSVMQPNEILAEKVCAILERSKARDLYDLYFLVMVKKIPISLKDIYEKCNSTSRKEAYSYKAFKASIGKLKTKWAELDPLLEDSKSYLYDEVSGAVLDAFRSL